MLKFSIILFSVILGMLWGVSYLYHHYPHWANEWWFFPAGVTLFLVVLMSPLWAEWLCEKTRDW